MPDIGSFTRIRSGGGDYNKLAVPYTWSGPSPPAGTYYWSSFPQLGKYSLIKDTPHRWREDQPKWDYPQGKVMHRVVDVSEVKYLAGSWKTPGGAFNENWTFFQDSVYPPMVLSMLDGMFDEPDISDPVYYNLTREAFNYFSDAFPQELSFSEFALGLRELGDLIPKLQDSIAKTFSGGFLNKTFGWDNLLSDLNLLSSVVRVAQDRLRYLKRTHGIPTRLGFHRQLEDTEVNHLVGDEFSYTWPASTFTTYLKIRSITTDFRSTATIVQTLDYLDGTIGLIRSMIGALGLNNPIKAIWAQLPFSFVLDWFFKISNHLDSLTRANPATGWEVHKVSSSTKASYVFDVSFNVLNGHSGGNTRTPFGTLRLSSYVRLPYLPVSVVDLLPTTNLSPTQLALFTALLHQGAR